MESSSEFQKSPSHPNPATTTNASSSSNQPPSTSTSVSSKQTAKNFDYEILYRMDSNLPEEVITQQVKQTLITLQKDLIQWRYELSLGYDGKPEDEDEMPEGTLYWSEEDGLQYVAINEMEQKELLTIQSEELDNLCNVIKEKLSSRTALTVNEEFAIAQVVSQKGYSVSLKRLGSGAFGIVYQGEYHGMPVAIKEVDPNNAGKGVYLQESEILQALDWEVSRMSTLSHTNLVRFYGVCENEKGNACLVMELCQKQTLQKRITHASFKKLQTAPPHSTDKKQPKALTEPALPPADIWRIALEMAYGLVYLHQKGTLHRDMKSENILFGFDGHTKLADLGVAQVDALVETQQAGVVEQGMKDLRYAAPEEFDGHSTPACDMYSYGLVLWEMVTGKIVDPNHKEWRKAGRTEEIPDYCPPALRDLIERCWSIDPKARPTAQNIILTLEAIAPEYIKQPVRACLAQQTLEILNEQRTALAEYIPSDVERPLKPVSSPKDEDGDKRDEEEQEEKDDEGDEENKGISPLDASIKPEERRQDPSIQTHLQHFIQSSSPVAVIIGAGGLGKSLASYVLADHLLQHPDPNTPLPLFIRPAITRWAHAELSNGIEKALTHYRLSPQAIEQLKQTPVLFIIDGYDELSGENQGNLPQQLGLDQWPNAKLLISVRPDAVPQEKLTERFAHHDQLVHHTLKPFDQPKVQIYLERALSPEEAASLEPSITQTSLGKTLTNPFVLSLFIKSWDSQKKQNLKQLTQAKIYQIAIQHWIYTQAHHLPPSVQYVLSGTTPQQSEQVDLAHLFKAAHLWLYQTAFAMVDHQTLSLTPIPNHPWNQLTQIVNHYAQDAIKARDQQIALLPEKEAALARKRALLNIERYQQLLQSKLQQFFALCPLKDRNGQHHFIHKTLFEYSVAKGIVVALARPDTPDATWGKLVRTLDLHPRMILWDAGVLHFLSTLAKPKDITDWEAWLEASKQDDAASRPAACAITALNGLRQDLTHRHWAEIRIPEADLRRAFLTETNLKGADLRNVRLEEATFNKTCLRHAQLQGVQFGQWPTLNFENEVYCMAFNPSSTLLATGLSNGQIVLQNPETQHVIAAFKGHTGGIGSVDFSPDEQYLVSTGRLSLSDEEGLFVEEYHSVRLWTVDTDPDCILNWFWYSHPLSNVVFSPDGQHLAAGKSKVICLWKVDTSSPNTTFSDHITLEGHTSLVTNVVFSPDGQYLASSSCDHTVRLWSTKTHTTYVTLNGHTNDIYGIAFSPDGKYLASGSDDKTVRLWIVDTGSASAIFEGHKSGVLSVAFSPDGKCLASSTRLYEDGVSLWAVNTGTIYAKLWGHTGQTSSVIFSPNGRVLAAGSAYDRAVRLWVTNTGSAPATLQKHTDEVTSNASLYWILNATECDIEGAIGLSQRDIDLLKELGAQGKPAPADTVTLRPNTQGSFHDSTGLSASLTTASTTVSKGAQVLHAPRVALSATELEDLYTRLTGSPTNAKPASGCMPSSSTALAKSSRFFGPIQSIDSSAPLFQSTTVATTTTQTTTTTTRVTTPLTNNTTSTSSGSAPTQKSSAAHLLTRFKGWTSKQTEKKPSASPHSMTKRR